MINTTYKKKSTNKTSQQIISMNYTSRMLNLKF